MLKIPFCPCLNPIIPVIFLCLFSVLALCDFLLPALTSPSMAFLLNKSTVFSRFQSQSQKTENPLFLSRRGFHIEPGTREKALLEADPALKKFKSHKKGVRRLKRLGDVLTIVVVTGCCYEIYVKAVMREEARKQAHASNEGAQ